MKRASRLQELQDLFSREHHSLYVAALAITRRRACAEDAVHDALIAVAEVDSQLENLKYYLYRAVRNRALYLAKRQDRLTSIDNDNDFFVSDSQSLELNTLAQQVNQHIGELEEKYQQVLLMKLFSDLTFDDIATIVDAPLNTVASWYRRGLAQLKERLHEREPIARTN